MSGITAKQAILELIDIIRNSSTSTIVDSFEGHEHQLFDRVDDERLDDLVERIEKSIKGEQQ